MKEITIDCNTISDKTQLHRSLSEALSFPAWYGNNLDALFDCLTEIDEETHLTFLNWAAVSAWAGPFRSTLTDAEEENPHFKTVFL